jgi:2-hydroxyacyl-CoA lyase 1
MPISPTASSSTRLEEDIRRLAARRLVAGQPTGHEQIASTLCELGVTHVYGVSGTPIHETLAACSQAGLRVIGTRHQQGSLLMAAAQNYLSGDLRGVPVLSAGPAVTNAATGVLIAQENCWPLVVLGGRRSRQNPTLGVFQELDGVSVLAPISKWATDVQSSAALASNLRKAARIAKLSRPGAVYLDLHEEALQGRVVTAADVSASNDPPPTLDVSALDQATALLSRAERPLVIAGKGLRWRDAWRELLTLVEDLQAPFIASPMGRGLLTDTHPLAATSVSGFVQKQADVVLVVGTRLNWQYRFGGQLAEDARVIQVDIDPTEASRSLREVLGLTGDALEILRELRQRLDGSAGAKAIAAQRLNWIEAISARKTEAALELEALARDESVPLSPYRVMREIREFLPPDSITVLDAHICMLVAQAMIPCRTPLSRLTVGTNGCLGVGLPFAIGARLWQPNRLVMAICGDSAFGFSVMEFETAVRHQVPIIVVVADNQGIWGGLIQKAHYPAGHDRVAMYGECVRYDRLAEGLGAHGEHVERPDQLRPALERAAASGRPSCINVRIDPFATAPPRM